jgi:ribonuclease HI
MDTIKLIVDATCRIANANSAGRPGWGHCACGYVIVDMNDNILCEGAKYIGEKTVPQAEMEGLVEGLEQAAAHGRNNIEVWSDSELVIKWMNGQYRLKKPEIRKLYDQAKQKEARFIGEKRYFWHNRSSKWAMHADKLAQAEYSKQHTGS